MITPFDESMLRRALRVAMNGRGRVEPNPMVGCVLVKNEKIIAEGHHTHFGGPHAEPTALADCVARGHSPAGATAYVTLEPCCHTNKKTPPCAPRLIEAGISRVVIGCLDPNPDVDGKGVAMLRAAGVLVDIASPALAKESLQLIVPFSQWRVYRTIKWAESADGRVAGANGTPVRITSAASNRVVHTLRSRCDSIVVGVNTVLSDDPLLTVRGVPPRRGPGEHDPGPPDRIVLDTNLRIPIDCRLVKTAHEVPTIVIAGSHAPYKFADKIAVLESHGVEIFTGDTNEQESVQFEEIVYCLLVGSAQRQTRVRHPHDRVGMHALFEAGPTVAQHFLPDADRLWVFRSAECVIGGTTSPRAAAIPPSYVETGRITLGPDTLVEYLNTAASSFVTATPSADFVLEAEAVSA